MTVIYRKFLYLSGILTLMLAIKIKVMCEFNFIGVGVFFSVRSKCYILSLSVEYNVIGIPVKRICQSTKMH